MFLGRFYLWETIFIFHINRFTWDKFPRVSVIGAMTHHEVQARPDGIKLHLGVFTAYICGSLCLCRGQDHRRCSLRSIPRTRSEGAMVGKWIRCR